MKGRWMKIGIALLMMLCTAFSFGAVAFADGQPQSSWNLITDLKNPNMEDENSPIVGLGKWIAEQLMYLYALLVAVVSIIFIIRHQYSKLVAFLVIAIIVAIPIFAPNAIPKIAESIANALSGNNGGK